MLELAQVIYVSHKRIAFVKNHHTKTAITAATTPVPTNAPTTAAAMLVRVLSSLEA